MMTASTSAHDFSPTGDDPDMGAVGSASEVLEELLESVAAPLGYEIVVVELAGSERRRILRVYLDRADGVEGVVGIDDCARMGRVLSAALDAISAEPGEAAAGARTLLDAPYTLEVSSPGLDRRLVKRRHFERFLGRRVVVRTTQPIAMPATDGQAPTRQRTFHGAIEGISPSPAAPENQRRGLVRLRATDGGDIFEIPLAAIRRANLVYDGK
jgi:ribosome maturation factor RimP